MRNTVNALRWIVEKTFDLAAYGVGAGRIRQTLDDEHIPTLAWLNYQRNGTFAHISDGQPKSRQYQWTVSNIKAILSSEVYIGYSVHNKQSTASFKNKKRVRNSKDEWFIVENTHEPIFQKNFVSKRKHILMVESDLTIAENANFCRTAEMR